LIQVESRKLVFAGVFVKAIFLIRTKIPISLSVSHLDQINNILKHSGAKNVTVQLSTLPAFIRLTITDDGRGFDTGKKNEGIGLRNIRNRAEFYDGSMRIITAPARGCTLEVSIPA
jgi:signal transduction histidine kinase